MISLFRFYYLNVITFLQLPTIYIANSNNTPGIKFTRIVIKDI